MKAKGVDKGIKSVTESERIAELYEIDLEVTPVIREIRIYADKEGKITIPNRYYSDVTYGDTIKGLTVALYSEGVSSNERTAAFLNEISGVDLGLSEGSVYNFCAQFADKAKETIAEIEREQSGEGILCTDTTCTSTNGKRSYIRNISSHTAVVYYAMENKAVSALEKIELLANYRGILVHDHESAMYHFGTGHAECNVHTVRGAFDSQVDFVVTLVDGNVCAEDADAFTDKWSEITETCRNIGLSVDFPDVCPA